MKLVGHCIWRSQVKAPPQGTAYIAFSDGFAGAGSYSDSLLSLCSRETLRAKKGTGPCHNADPNNLDFTTLRYYGSENRTVSPYRHIMDRHVLPNSKPGTTRYVFGSDFTGVHNPAQTMTAVIKWDQLTFAKGTATQQGNGNIQFLYTIPPIKIDTGFGILTLKGIGQTLSGGWLRTSGLVVAGNCTSVVTPRLTVP